MSASAAFHHDVDSWLSHHQPRPKFTVHYAQSRRFPLEREPANNSLQDPIQSSQDNTSFQRPKHGVEIDVPQVEQNPQILKDRIRNAMRRRVGPDTGLTVKMVARATGLTERTIENASSGTIPRGDTLMALLDFFDATFANEIFAGATFLVVKLSDQRAAEAARQINEGVRVLAELQRRG